MDFRGHLKASGRLSILSFLSYSAPAHPCGARNYKTRPRRKLSETDFQKAIGEVLFIAKRWGLIVAAAAEGDVS
jgi:hypothetical protein